LELLRKKGYLAVNQPGPVLPKTNTAAPSKSAPTVVDPQPAAPSPTVPTAFGIYAVSDGKLHELDVLPGRAPDPRIAISSIITANSRTTLPDGHVAFVIYRRDSATNAADRAEVRVVARIERESNFNKDGKQVVTAVDDIAMKYLMPHRTAPRRTIRKCTKSERKSDGPLPLAATRLCLKALPTISVLQVRSLIPGNAERLVATNGRFYSECKK
jgi:hypothetical protein